MLCTSCDFVQVITCTKIICTNYNWVELYLSGDSLLVSYPSIKMKCQRLKLHSEITFTKIYGFENSQYFCNLDIITLKFRNIMPFSWRNLVSLKPFNWRNLVSLNSIGFRVMIFSRQEFDLLGTFCENIMLRNFRVIMSKLQKYCEFSKP
jgi:hypothetical protein